MKQNIQKYTPPVVLLRNKVDGGGGLQGLTMAQGTASHWHWKRK